MMDIPVVKGARRLASELYARVLPARYKQAHELKYWRGRVSQEGVLKNAHYAPIYTTFFGLEPAFYAGKRVLDVGFGPRGSLEWADMAAERVGLDPLVPAYLKLGAAAHRMTYVAAPAHRIPFADGHFDVVCTFNSLDHVDDIDGTIVELKRVTRPGGTLLLIVEVNHPPTAAEPVVLEWDVLERFADAFDVERSGRYEIGDHDIFGQLNRDARYDENDLTDRPGIVTARLVKRATQ